MKSILLSFLFASLPMVVSQICYADLILVQDAFSSSMVVGDNRFQSDDVDSGNWLQRLRQGEGGTWAVSGGALTNPASMPGTDDDQAVHLLNSVTSTDTSLTGVVVSFDYSVDPGSTLYFHSSLFAGPNMTIGNMARMTRTGGDYYAEDFNENFASAYNLDGGATPTNSVSNALVSFTGSSSGTFTQTYDISAFNGVNSIADISHVLVAFAADTSASGNGGIAVGNFTVTAVPEPSALALFGMVLCFAGGRRRRRVRVSA